MANNKMVPHLIDPSIKLMDRLPNATLAEVIGNLFLPIGKITRQAQIAFQKRFPKGKSITSKDGLLTLTVNRPLSQEHKNLLDVLVSNLTPYYAPGSKAPFFFFTPNWLTTRMGFPKDTRRLNALIDYLREMTLICKSHVHTTIFREDKMGLIASSGRFYDGATDLNLNAKGELCDGLHYIQINENYIQAYELDKTLRYAPLIDRIIDLPEAVLQAAVRLAISFPELNMVLEDTTAADGKERPGFISRMGITGRTAYYETRRVLIDNKDLFLNFGLTLKPDGQGRWCMYKPKDLDGVLPHNPKAIKDLKKKASAEKDRLAEKQAPTEGAKAARAKAPRTKAVAASEDTDISPAARPNRIVELIECLSDPAASKEAKIRALQSCIEYHCVSLYHEVLALTQSEQRARASYANALDMLCAKPEVRTFIIGAKIQLNRDAPAPIIDADDDEI